jgi:hypothetical protein
LFKKNRRKPLKGHRNIRLASMPWRYIIKSIAFGILFVVLIYQFAGFSHYYRKAVGALDENKNLSQTVSVLTSDLNEERIQRESVIVHQINLTEEMRQQIQSLTVSLEETLEENRKLNDYLDSTKSQNNVLRQKLETLLGTSSRSGSDLAYSTTGKSGLSLDELKKLTRGTGLEGTEEAFLTIEVTNNVNALFALSVAKLESASGNSALARNQNNLFGFRGHSGWMSFKTKTDSVIFFGRLIESNYVGKGFDTVDKIGPRYAEGSTTWAEKVKAIMISDMRRAHN